ncbi:heme-degrading domain-containing protein [Paenibacillus guangzhouensis]|uniref:heme-degrading domain-containing protein n=1 Tax=Paenibacillus guangzhouensis TaxID=1473112 RepID=UPI001266D0AD|nr:heme-degrading domain-containing protein [Paenibacillus guangzhouensis]
MSIESFDQKLEMVIQEEETLQYASFTNEDALELGLKIIDLAKKAGQSIAIDITNHGVQVFHYMMTGTTQVNNEWLERKRRVVSLSNHSSYYLELEGAKTGITYNDRNLLDASIYGPYGGGFPIVVQGSGIIGIITVSGLTSEEDHELIVKALRSILNK